MSYLSQVSSLRSPLSRFIFRHAFKGVSNRAWAYSYLLYVNNVKRPITTFIASPKCVLPSVFPQFYTSSLPMPATAPAFSFSKNINWRSFRTSTSSQSPIHSVSSFMLTPHFYTFQWFTLSCINSAIAQSKNRSGLGWFLLSIPLGPVATALLCLLPPNPTLISYHEVHVECPHCQREAISREKIAVESPNHHPSSAHHYGQTCPNNNSCFYPVSDEADRSGRRAEEKKRCFN
eukprot:GCRY01002436.1.p1 GENE.GCRY01002436.1~~GCRY01002436.1.p1  ORF type:complete len:233 (+),score=2.96 GCRY01002436.1:293-991(+)